MSACSTVLKSHFELCDLARRNMYEISGEVIIFRLTKAKYVNKSSFIHYYLQWTYLITYLIIHNAYYSILHSFHTESISKGIFKINFGYLWSICQHVQPLTWYIKFWCYIHNQQSRRLKCMPGMFVVILYIV